MVGKLPKKEELKAGYLVFSKFVFELLEDMEVKKENLMIAAANSQIALELFLKYLYSAKGKVDEIRKNKAGVLTDDFREFNEILNHFYSRNPRAFGNKKDFVELMQARNSIVHKGQRSQWDSSLAKIIVKTYFFMHNTAWYQLGELLLEENYIPHKVSGSQVWREGVEEFCDELSELQDFYPLICSRCGCRSVISGELFVLQENQYEDYISCLCCLSSINIEHEARLIDCYKCSERSYLLDAFNDQGKQLHPGKCTDCDTDTWARKCKSCKDFYHPSAVEEFEREGVFCCSEICMDLYEEILLYKSNNRSSSFA